MLKSLGELINMYEFFQPEKPFEAEVIALFVQIVWKRRHIKKLDGLRG